MTRCERVKQILYTELLPSHLDVINESHQHRTPAGAETHLLVVVVSEQFQGLSRLQRQQRIYQLLEDELKQGLHALSQRLFTPDEWKKSQQFAPSPACAHKT